MLLGFALGLVASNALEWTMHKYVLHGLGKKKDSFWAFHWHDHHKRVRKTGGHDENYEIPLYKNPIKAKEVLGVVSGAVLTTPLILVSPGFVAAGWTSAGLYYYLHRRSHLEPEWANKYMPWHVDHHLGPNQHKNWCVTWPLFDWIMGTREPFIGTEAEHKKPEAAVVTAPAA